MVLRRRTAQPWRAPGLAILGSRPELGGDDRWGVRIHAGLDLLADLDAGFTRLRG